MSVTSKTRPRGRAALAATGLAVLLSACTSGEDFTDTVAIGREVLSRTISPDTSDVPQQITPAQLQQIAAATDLPIVLFSSETSGSSAALVQIERNGNVRTYATAARQTVALQNGLVRGTRGLGDDLMSVDLGSLPALVAARRSGTTEREIRFLDGEEVTDRLRFTCTVQAAPADGGLTTMTETCRQQNGPERFTNTYQVDGRGRVVGSRQWLSRLQGYATIRQIRF